MPSPSEPARQADALVIGAGVSGLSAALALLKRGLNVLVLEESDRPGGVVGTDALDGYLCERGPHTLVLQRPETAEALDHCGLLESAIGPSPKARNRYVLRSWNPVPLPRGPIGALTTPILDAGAKLRLLREPFVPRGDDPDETVADFFSRRCGFEFYRRVVNAFCNGVYAGDPRQMVMRHALPSIWEAEQRHGSLFKGLRARRRERTGPPARMISWPRGLQQLVDGFVRPLGSRLICGASVSQVERRPDGFCVRTNQGEFTAPRLVVATPAPVTPFLLSEPCPELEILHEIRHAPLVLVHLGYKRKYVDQSLDGFGTLVSRSQRMRLLGVLYPSSIFPGRAPKGDEDFVLLTAFAGGILDGGILSVSDGELVELVMQTAGMFLGLRGMPYFSHVVRWPAAIPQYEGDHDEVLAACNTAERNNPGLRLVGSYRGGVSLGDCIANGWIAGRDL